MAPLTILTDDNVKDILQDLTKEEVKSMQNSLRKALHEYSTAHQDQPACAANQPERMTMDHHNGTTTLFMPSKAAPGIAMKVVTLAAPSPNLAVDNEERDSSGTSPKAGQTPQGGLMLMRPDGKPFGFLNAEELTAFRTALASSLLMVRRKKVKTIAVFGTGKQSFWHVRLALLFHGATIQHVHIINHRFTEKARDFFKTLVGMDEDIKKSEGWTRAKFGMISPSYNEYERMAKDQIRSADIIICGTPSEKPLFHHSILTGTNGRIKPRLIIAVGSFNPNMIELPPEILMQAVKHHGDHLHVRKRAVEGGCVIADVAKAMEQTGEFLGAKLEPHHVVELGEIVMLEEQFAHAQDDDDSAIDDGESYASSDNLTQSDGKSSLASVLSEASLGSSSRRSSRSSSFSSLPRRSSLIFRNRKHTLGSHPPEKKASKDEREMNDWLVNGNVIYKSVGLGLMDLVVGVDIIKVAKIMNIGITIPDF